MEYGLIGGKLGHSYSKTIHELLCGYSYELCPLPTEADARAFLQRRQFKAINVTIPYKKLVMEYCSFIDPRARAIGAVNTVVNKNGLLYGYNTDYLGFAHLCEAHGVELAGKTVLIEECMTGPECSLLAFVTNGRACCMAPAQDHKRAFDGDRGPNTGGMGVYSPVPIVTSDEMDAMTRIMETAAAATAREPFDADYRGVLYGGFMLTPQGPKIVEFNVRFGDPETQVVLPRLESDLVEVMLAVAEGRPEDVQLEWSDDWAVSVVLASEGYPGAYEKGKVILGIEEAEELPGVTVFHAGTRRNYDGELLTNGGRVLNVVAKGDSFEEARERAYEACDLINFEGKMFRHDIGKKALQGRSAWDQ